MAIEPAKIILWTGDRLPTFTFTIKRGGDAVNLTGHTLAIKIVPKQDTSTTTQSGNPAIAVAASGTCTYTLSAALAKGVYLAQVTVTNASSLDQKTDILTLEVKEAL